MNWSRRVAPLALAGLLIAAAACGDDDDTGGSDNEETTAPSGAAGDTTATTAGGEAPATSAAGGEAPATSTAGGEAPAEGEGITLAVNPWTGSAVNAQVAKVVLESEVGTPVELVDIDENATWPGMAAGDIDAVLEVWPSGHARDRTTYIDEQGSVVDLGPLGAQGTIGWYVPSFVVEEHPELATWEGFKDPELAGLFATAETGDRGQFLLGAASYVSYDEEIIANLELPLQVVVAGSEAAEITAIEQAFADNSPLLLYFWQPHWLHSRYELTEVELPEFTDECAASAEADDGNYDCEYPVDELYKAASAGLEEKNPAAFAFLQNFQLTTEQQNEIAALIDSDGMEPEEAAATWVEENPDVVGGWLG
jgi:glycine betaine/proline transport system substrate-binding protein